MERTTVYLPIQMKMSIKSTAKRRGLSEAEIIRQALDSFLTSDQSSRPRLKSIGMGEVDDVLASRFDEWLAENWDHELFGVKANEDNEPSGV